MNVKRISAISLSYRDYGSFQEKIDEACRWVTLAGRMGSDLAVLPENLEMYRGDGPNNPNQLPVSETALDDWQTTCRNLIACAVECGIAVTIPVNVRDGDGYLNCSFLVSRTGELLGRYAKMYPTPGELDVGIKPGGEQDLIKWEGLKVGGAICADMNTIEPFRNQAARGAELFLCPSLSPGGPKINQYAQTLSTPIVIAYPAWSRIIDIDGRELAAGGYRYESLRFGFGVPIYTADVNFDKAVIVSGKQETIEEMLNRYGADVRITFDQDNCWFILESRSPDLTVNDVMREFDIPDRRGWLRTERERLERAEQTEKGIASS